MLKSVFPAVLMLGVSVVNANSENLSSPYQLIERGEQTIRLNTNTGAVSICDKLNGQLACRAAADERKSWMHENASLEARIEVLEDRIALLEKNASKGPGRTEDKKELSQQESGKPSMVPKVDGKQIDQALEKAEHVLRGFVTMMKDLKDDFQNRQ